jgi:hypothetical protein
MHDIPTWGPADAAGSCSIFSRLEPPPPLALKQKARQNVRLSKNSKGTPKRIGVSRSFSSHAPSKKVELGDWGNDERDFVKEQKHNCSTVQRCQSMMTARPSNTL